jgi:hypothetical protein
VDRAATSCFPRDYARERFRAAAKAAGGISRAYDNPNRGLVLFRGRQVLRQAQSGLVAA